MLKDGQAHTFYFLFWADVASQATIDVVRLWESVGTCSTGDSIIMRVKHTGFMGVTAYLKRTGSGTPVYDALVNSAWSGLNVCLELSGQDAYPRTMTPFLVPAYLYIFMRGSVSTDLNHPFRNSFMLRSER